MKRIILVRHATAVRRGAGVDDFDRTLRRRGRREAAAVALWYSRYLPAPDLLLSSPAGRAIETAEAFAAVLEYPRRRIATDRRIYDAAEPGDLLDVLRGIKDRRDSVMVFGHDPVFTEFAASIAPGFDQPLPKCAVVVVDTRRRRWATLRPGDGRVVAFQHPEALAAARRAARETRELLERRIESAVAGALAEFGVTIDGDDDRERVRKAGRRLARRFAFRVPEEPSAGGTESAG